MTGRGGSGGGCYLFAVQRWSRGLGLAVFMACDRLGLTARPACLGVLVEMFYRAWTRAGIDRPGVPWRLCSRPTQDACLGLMGRLQGGGLGAANGAPYC